MHLVTIEDDIYGSQKKQKKKKKKKKLLSLCPEKKYPGFQPAKKK